MSSTFAVGALVRARGREWVVLPGSDPETLLLRPLGGTDEEVAGVHLPLEKVEPAQFELPSPDALGDFHEGRLLRDAVRLGLRSSAGPFRSFARIAVDPRPYQLVPLLMALKQDPVRLLIADDVGVGKTIEACLAGRELFDRGEIERMAVLCPPHLAEQWRRTLEEQFHLPAALVLPSTVARLERGLRLDESLFQRYPHVVVSLDFIKSERHRQEFLNHCPDLVIVDEAHGCAAGKGSTRHRRHELLAKIASREGQHLILVTATPHSGNVEAFGSLLGLLDPAFEGVTGEVEARGELRERLANHLVQRRRGDIDHFLGEATPFPKRRETEMAYQLGPTYLAFFREALSWARERIVDEAGGKQRQRVRWWAAIALLRAIGSSPAAAAETLRNRALNAEDESSLDELARRTLLDGDAGGDEVVEGTDVSGGAEVEPADATLAALATRAAELAGAGDEKLAAVTKAVKGLVDGGFRPIVFCRFIATAEYVAEHLRSKLKAQVIAVTGRLPPEAREAAIAELAPDEPHVLVATDCLSEGINLQDGFDAVVHYDLAWNPTRHEQREGRVDRYGQKRREVRVLRVYGRNNPIDGLVLEVLLKKHEAIREALGVSVPMPSDTDVVVEAIMRGALLRAKPGDNQLPLFAEDPKNEREALHREWQASAERERQSRTIFAQRSLKPEEVAGELAEARAAIGGPADVARFVPAALRAAGAAVAVDGARMTADATRAPRGLSDVLRPHVKDLERIALTLPGADADPAVALSRTHPLVEAMAGWVVGTALDGSATESVARRAGVMRTKAVERRTTLLLLRARFHLTTTERDRQPRTTLAEDVLTVAFAGAPAAAEWLDAPAAERLLDAEPAGNVTPEQARDLVARAVAGAPELAPPIEAHVRGRAEALLASHRRVRAASRRRFVTYSVEPVLPPDWLGVFVLLPV